MSIKIGMCAHFGGDKNFTDGQTVKSKSIKRELVRLHGEEAIVTLDTYQWKKKPLQLVLTCMKMIKACDHIVILPGDKGLKVFAPIFYWFNLRKKCKIHYSVIGGWLPFFVESNLWILKYLESFENIFVETNKMKSLMDRQHLKNVRVIPNFKDISLLTSETICYTQNAPYKLCTFSRVMKTKGIEEAIDAVVRINNHYNKVVATLDVYGMINEDEMDWFEALFKDQPDYINYCDVVPYDQSTDVLKDYFMLLFPTRYPGEGHAGTLIDAFASGLPVIASDWRYNSEIVKEGQVGYLYNLNDKDALFNRLLACCEDPNQVNAMKLGCLQEAKRYMPDEVMHQMLSWFK